MHSRAKGQAAKIQGMHDSVTPAKRHARGRVQKCTVPEAIDGADHLNIQARVLSISLSSNAKDACQLRAQLHRLYIQCRRKKGKRKKRKKKKKGGIRYNYVSLLLLLLLLWLFSVVIICSNVNCQVTFFLPSHTYSLSLNPSFYQSIISINLFSIFLPFFG